MNYKRIYNPIIDFLIIIPFIFIGIPLLVLVVICEFIEKKLKGFNEWMKK